MDVWIEKVLCGRIEEQGAMIQIVTSAQLASPLLQNLMIKLYNNALFMRFNKN